MVALFFYSEAKGAGEFATADERGGTDGVVQFPAEGDLEMVLDRPGSAAAVESP